MAATDKVAAFFLLLASSYLVMTARVSSSTKELAFAEVSLAATASVPYKYNNNNNNNSKAPPPTAAIQPTPTNNKTKPPSPSAPTPTYKAPPPVAPAYPPPPTPPAPVVAAPNITNVDIKECPGLCDKRCALHSRPNHCHRVCGTCCVRCRCVPPGTAGNREMCGKCYTDMTTHRNQTKCP